MRGVAIKLLTFLVAVLLALVPLPEGVAPYRPEWVSMVLIYWVMATPSQVGLGWAWLSGLSLDLLEGSVMGLNAMTHVVIAWVILATYRRIRRLTLMQQCGSIALLLATALLLGNWLKIVVGQPVLVDYRFLLAAVTSAIIWPVLFFVLRWVRRRYRVG